MATVTTETIPVELTLVGSVEAAETVQIKPQVTGQIASVHFAEGALVRKGDLLFSIDDREFRQALAQAEGAVARDRAVLQQAIANVARDTAQSKYAAGEAARYSELAAAGVISKAQYEQLKNSSEITKASLLSSQAAVESSKANLTTDLAAVERAKIDISYCAVKSPINGRAGTILMHAGNIAKANDTALVVINRVSPVFVTFNVPERYLSAIRAGGSRLPVKAALRDNPSAATNGFVTVIDNAVDPASGSIRLKASFENGNNLLWPGQFADVVLRLGSVQNTTVVPVEAVQPGQKGPYVFRVKQDQTVESVQVETGETHENKIAILKGVNPGDVVITDGHLRLAPGARVKKGVVTAQ
jgi:multidrug efflux system membrane fusion protein